MTDERADQGSGDDMTLLMEERQHDWRDLVRSIHDDLELPDGFRAEIIGGDITVTSGNEEHADEVRDLVRSIHDNLDLPDGYRAEIIGGRIVVAASPFTRHAYIAKQIAKAVDRAVLPDFEAFENITVEGPDLDRYIPDVAVWPVSEVRGGDRTWIMESMRCIFTAEITSPQQERRDYEKAVGYARGGVPIYLLVDRKARKCIVHTDPKPTGYETRCVTPFGTPVTLVFDTGTGEPRIATIDTSDF